MRRGRAPVPDGARATLQISFIVPLAGAMQDRRAMKRIVLCACLAASLAGCVVAGRPATRTQTVVVEEDRRCQPAHHWEPGVGCVHNGKAKGHYK